MAASIDSRGSYLRAAGPAHAMITPQRIGRFLAVDGFGRVQPDVANHLVDGTWKPLVDFVVHALLKRQAVRSIYIRGSIPRGLAIENVSDADFLYFSEVNGDAADRDLEKSVAAQFPFVRGVELFRFGRAEFDARHDPKLRPYFHMLLKTQSLFLAGEDIARDIEPFRIGPEMAAHILSLEKEFSLLPGLLKTARQEGSGQSVRQWFSRRVVRSGLEVTMGRTHRFTRDLYLCYEDFAKLYPERSGQMYQVLINCLNGKDSPIQYDELVRFLAKEASHAESALASSNWKAIDPCVFLPSR